MKKIQRESIIHVEKTDVFENIFICDILYPNFQDKNIEVFYMRHLLEKKKNESILERLKKHPAMWSEVYSPKDELEIFTEIFENALKTWKKVHIVGISLWEEIRLLEEYYLSLWFFVEETNTFRVDFSKVCITASCYIENIMWRGSDYKRMGEKIFLCPPIREAGQVKNLFRGINRWSLAGVVIEHLTLEVEKFLEFSVVEEHILPLTLGRVLKYNFEDIWFEGTLKTLFITF